MARTSGSKQIEVPTFLRRPGTVPDQLSWLVGQYGGRSGGSLSTVQMRRIADAQAVPQACRATLKHIVSGLDWWISDEPEPDAKDNKDTERGKHYYRVLRDMADSEGNLVGFSTAVDLFADDILTARQGGCWEVIRDKKGVPHQVLHVDAATIRFTHERNQPVYQVAPTGAVSQLWEADRFGQARWHPDPRWGASLYNRTPIQLAYSAIAILASSDTYNFKIITEPIPEGILNLGPGFNHDKAVQWKASWDAAMQGIQPQPLHVVYGTSNFQYQAFRPALKDMAFESTSHWYASLVAACFEMSILDISILTKVATKAAAEMQAEATEKQGLRNLMKKIREAIEKYILEEGVFFHWEDISKKDEDTESQIASRNVEMITGLVQAKMLTEEQGIVILQGWKNLPDDIKYETAEFEKRKEEAMQQFQQKKEEDESKEKGDEEENSKKKGGEAEKETEKSALEKAKRDTSNLLKRKAKEKPLKPLKDDDAYWEVDEAYLDELAARVDAGVRGE